MPERRIVVGVMGGSKASEPVSETAYELGKLIAQRGWVLLNGGRNAGVMAASARGAKEAGGTVIGILPDRTPREASPDLDYVIVTGMGDARNVINVLSSDVVIACPGKMGTLSEVVLALGNGKAVILLGWDVGEEFDSFRRRGLLVSVETPAEAVAEVHTLLDAR